MRVERCFAFVDLSGFTAFTEHQGDERTVVVLASFRTHIREIAARRGVRVTKWLGDGAMLASSQDTPAVVAMVIELCPRRSTRGRCRWRSERAWPRVPSSCSRAMTTSAERPTWRPVCAMWPRRERCFGHARVASLAPLVGVQWSGALPTRPRDSTGPLEASLPRHRRESAVMITDDCCGLVLPEVTGLDTRFGSDGSVHRLCSAACALSWEQRQKRMRAAAIPRYPNPLHVTADPDLGLEPLTARSLLLSVLLGSHPPVLAVRTLVRTAEVFGIAEGTARVALSRLSADGDVVAESGSYQLSPRLLERQRRQDGWLRPTTRPWRGGWEMAVASDEVRGALARASLGNELAALRLAELRPGVWTRPDNLVRAWPEELTERVWRFETGCRFTHPPAAEMAARLWDLRLWARTAESLIQALASSGRPAGRFVIGAAMVRHLGGDPILPHSLLPSRWPGPRLRSVYSAYRREVGELMARERCKVSTSS